MYAAASDLPIASAGSARSDSQIAAITRLDGALDVFWIGPDGQNLDSVGQPEEDWQPPFPIALANPARPGSPLAAVTI